MSICSNFIYYSFSYKFVMVVNIIVTVFYNLSCTEDIEICPCTLHPRICHLWWCGDWWYSSMDDGSTNVTVITCRYLLYLYTSFLNIFTSISIYQYISDAVRCISTQYRLLSCFNFIHFWNIWELSNYVFLGLFLYRICFITGTQFYHTDKV